MPEIHRASGQEHRLDNEAVLSAAVRTIRNLFYTGKISTAKLRDEQRTKILMTYGHRAMWNTMLHSGDPDYVESALRAAAMEFPKRSKPR
jgi:hypothetical protein